MIFAETRFPHPDGHPVKSNVVVWMGDPALLSLGRAGQQAREAFAPYEVLNQFPGRVHEFK